MTRIALLLVCFMLVGTFAADAREEVLIWGGAPSGEFVYQETAAHFVRFECPVMWDNTFIDSVQFYGRTYGNVGDLQATIVIFGPPEGETEINTESEEKLSVLQQKMFPLGSIPETGGWINIDLKELPVPSEFAVAIFTYSNEQRGLEIDLGERSQRAGLVHSSTVELRHMIPSMIEYREDGREWSVRIAITDLLNTPGGTDAAAITGPGYSDHDDGSAEDFATSQKHGPMVRFKNNRARTVERVYVYGHLAGDWFGTERSFTVYLLDSDLRIIERSAVRYDTYTSEAAWHYAEFHYGKVPREYYILVEPVSSPDVQFMIGADLSQENHGSLWGTVGILLDWAPELEEGRTNWMIRADYQ